jgi:ERCC4-type nuclease
VDVRNSTLNLLRSALCNNVNRNVLGSSLLSRVAVIAPISRSLAALNFCLIQRIIMSSQGSAASGRSRGGAGRGGGGRGGGFRGGGRGYGLPSSLAAVATAPLRNQAGYASYVVPKAKNVVNQPLLEKLAESRSKIDPTRNKFALTLKSAMDNLSKHPDAVSTYKQACLVRGIGKKIAHMLFPNDDNDNRDGGGAGDDHHGDLGRFRATNDDPNHHKSTIDGGGAIEAAASRKRMRQTTISDAMFPSSTLLPSSSSSQLFSTAPSPQGSVASNASSTASNPTRRQVQYHREATKSWHQLWKNQNLMWNVLFVVDNREKKDGRDRLCDKFSSANIPFEVRQLPIGDMTWIAQGRKRRHGNSNSNNNNDSPTKGPVVVELVLGTIIERKTLVDLTASIHGTRYAEQRMRMVQSGLSQCILLLEGNVHREATTSSSECHHKRLDACHTALWETCLYLNFQILRTADMGETISTLKLMHRRILQRSFPQAFSSEVLPTFDEPSRGGRRRDDTSSSIQCQQQQALEVGQRKRRRYQSLHKLVFDTDPVVPPGMDRFVTYNELKAKVGRDREAGLRTVRMVHGAMVKQVPKIENKRAAAIVHAYPTPTLLFEAYHHQQTEQHKQLLLRDLDTSMVATTAEDGTTNSNRPTIRKCTVGLEGSKQMYVAYGMSKKASERPSYAEQVERVQQEQQEQRRRKSSGSSSSGGGGGGCSGEKKRPAAASSSLRDSRNRTASPPLDNEWYGLSQLSEESSHSAAAVTFPTRLELDESSRDSRVDTRRLEFAENSSRAAKAPPKQSTSAMMRKKPPPIPPAAAASRAAMASANQKPPPAASNQSYRRRSPSQQVLGSSALGSSEASAASSNSRAALLDRPACTVACAAPVPAPSQEAVIDLCDDDSSDDDDSYRRPRTPTEDVAGGGSSPKDDDDAETEEDDDDDYDYSPVVKKPAAHSIASIREPLSSLCNGSPTRPSLPSLSAAASENRRPILNPYAKSNKSRYSLGSLSVSTSASSSCNSAAPAAAASFSSNKMPRSQQSTGGRRRRSSLTLDELGLGSSSSCSDDDDDDDDCVDSDRRLAAAAAKPAPIAAALPPRRKAREPEVYEILSD